MKKSLRYLIILAFIGSAVWIASFTGCEKESPTSLYDSTFQGKPQPRIDSVSPSSGALAGVGIVTVYGKDFSVVTTENTVYFDLLKGTVQTATTTQLVVKTPVLVKDTIAVKVRVEGATAFSNIKSIGLNSAVSEFGNFNSFDEANGIACDQAGNLYAAMLSNGAGIGIRMYSPSGDSSTFTRKYGVDIWSGMKMGPGGKLYACRNQTAIYTISAGQQEVIFQSIQRSKLFDLDFDKNLNIWSGGLVDTIYSILPNKTFKKFAFLKNANVRSIRVYKDYLYIGGTVDSVSGVWRAPIDAGGNLGIIEKYFDLSIQPGYSYNGAIITAITFNSDGDMYVGTNGNEGILLVRSATPTVSEPFYSGLFVPGAENYAFAWGSGATLYVSRRDPNKVIPQILLKINTQKQSAPYYGRGDL